MSNTIYDPRSGGIAEILALYREGLLSHKEARAIVAQWFPIVGQIAASEKKEA